MASIALHNFCRLPAAVHNTSRMRAYCVLLQLRTAMRCEGDSRMELGMEMGMS